MRKLVYICLALLTIGATACTVQKSSTSKGRAVIVINDTTIIEHQGAFNFRTK